MPAPTIQHEFDISPITPGAIKRMLRKCKSNSTPGPDGISYHHLKKLPSTHHFLATLYTKILTTSQLCPPAWGSGKIILIHKKGDNSSPANYRPIVLSSTVGKLLHKFIASRLEEFCLANGIIDSSLQKGFLTGINGTMEHIFAVSTLIDHACSNGLPVSMTFIDLRNAFGSISHQLVNDILAHLKIPEFVRLYIRDAYTHLQAYVSTKKWLTPLFSITRGVFQGDTMSPIIFLMSFNPVIRLAQSLKYPGFTFRIPIPNSEDLPETGSTIYTLWNEPSSDEPPGWYRCAISGYMADGTALLSYPDGKCESVQLSETTWTFARKSAKKYRLQNTPPPNFVPVSHKSTTKYRDSTEHKVKGFADDLTIINSSKHAHKQALSEIDTKCLDLDLHIRPDKCVSFSFNSSKVDRSFTVPLESGNTSNISDRGVRFLGRILMGTSNLTCSNSSNTLITTFRTSLQALDTRPIRGEYKLWIYKHYLAPSTHFYLAVNPTSITAIKKVEAFATKALKKWLKLPRNATQATLYHPKVLNMPHYSSLKVKAKLSFLVAIDQSTDQLIQELKPLLSVPIIRKGLDIPPKCSSILDRAKESITTLPGIKKHCNKQLESIATRHWDDHLNTLQVQKKFSDIVALEKENRSWKKIMNNGLTSGQLSFLLRAGSDTLPTPMNLRRMRIQHDSRCPLCKAPRPTTAHILNGCHVALNQGRYTWRHDSVLSSLSHSLSRLLPSTYKLFADLDGLRAEDNPPTTIPPTVLTTSLRPDLVILENQNSIRMLELTVPTNTPEGLRNARDRKQNKTEYGILCVDLEDKGWIVSYDTIEIGSLGHYTSSASEAVILTLPLEHIQSTKRILQEAAKTAISCSQQIFLAHKLPDWNPTRPLI